MRIPVPALLALWREITGRPPGPLARLSPREQSAVIPALRHLAGGFGGSRNIAGHDYWEDPELLGAYLLFYWPISFVQAHAVLQLSAIKPLGRALDLGSGAGPAACALRQLGWGDVVAADRGGPALRAAEWLSGGMAAQGRFKSQRWDAQAGQALPEGPWGLIFAQHLFNELWKHEADRIERRRALLLQAAEWLLPGGKILLVEPARHVINAELLELRDSLAEVGLYIHGPCFRQQACPARAEGAACHGELRWEPPPEVAHLAEAAHIDRSTLAFSWLLIGRELPVSHPSRLRVVSETRLNKAGRERALVCGEAGRFSLSAPARSHAPWARTWHQLGRGDAIQVEQPEIRESGWGLSPESRLKIVGSAQD